MDRLQVSYGAEVTAEFREDHLGDLDSGSERQQNSERISRTLSGSQL